MKRKHPDISMNIEMKLISAKTSQNVQSVNPAEIICCILNGRKVDILLISEKVIQVRHNLKTMEEKLKAYHFLRCHAKFLINMDLPIIFDSKNREIELENKVKVPVAKDRKATVNRLLNGKNGLPETQYL